MIEVVDKGGKQPREEAKGTELKPSLGVKQEETAGCLLVRWQHLELGAEWAGTSVDLVQGLRGHKQVLLREDGSARRGHH